MKTGQLIQVGSGLVAALLVDSQVGFEHADFGRKTLELGEPSLLDVEALFCGRYSADRAIEASARLAALSLRSPWRRPRRATPRAASGFVRRR